MQKEFFEGGAAAFERDGSREVKQLKRQISDFEDRLARMDSALAEITEAYVRLKKRWGNLRQYWVRRAVRDDIVRFVRDLSARTGISIW